MTEQESLAASASEIMTPILQAQNPTESAAFYAAAGFVVSYWQETPYFYGAMERGAIRLNFIKGKSPGTVLVHVPRAGVYHRAISDGLRAHYGKVPLAGFPRISRWWSWHTRFRLFDPTGNEFIVVDLDESPIDYDAYDATLSPLRQALVNVEFVRDVYTDDKTASKVLDRKLAEMVDAAPADRARALGVRAELAVAMGDDERLAQVRAELASISLLLKRTPEVYAEHAQWIEAGDRLEAWMGAAV